MPTPAQPLISVFVKSYFSPYLLEAHPTWHYMTLLFINCWVAIITEVSHGGVRNILVSCKIMFWKYWRSLCGHDWTRLHFTSLGHALALTLSGLTFSINHQPKSCQSDTCWVNSLVVEDGIFCLPWTNPVWNWFTTSGKSWHLLENGLHPASENLLQRQSCSFFWKSCEVDYLPRLPRIMNEAIRTGI